MCYPGAIVVSIIGICKSAKGLKANGKYHTFAVIGLILSIVGLVAAVFLDIVFILNVFAQIIAQL